MLVGRATDGHRRSGLACESDRLRRRELAASDVVRGGAVPVRGLGRGCVHCRQPVLVVPARVRERYKVEVMSFPRTSRLIGPSFEHATVADAMRVGIISCQADTSLRAIAELMASYHVHAVVVEGADAESGAAPGQGWGIVSDVELARAAARGELEATAGELAGSGAMSIGPAEPLTRAAELMSEHRVSHLIVSTAPTARPVGIISTLDLAVALAWGRG